MGLKDQINKKIEKQKLEEEIFRTQMMRETTENLFKEIQEALSISYNDDEAKIQYAIPRREDIGLNGKIPYFITRQMVEVDIRLHLFYNGDINPENELIKRHNCSIPNTDYAYSTAIQFCDGPLAAIGCEKNIKSLLRKYGKTTEEILDYFNDYETIYGTGPNLKEGWLIRATYIYIWHRDFDKEYLKKLCEEENILFEYYENKKGNISYEKYTFTLKLKEYDDKKENTNMHKLVRKQQP